MILLFSVVAGSDSSAFLAAGSTCTRIQDSSSIQCIAASSAHRARDFAYAINPCRLIQTMLKIHYMLTLVFLLLFSKCHRPVSAKSQNYASIKNCLFSCQTILELEACYHNYQTKRRSIISSHISFSLILTYYDKRRTSDHCLLLICVHNKSQSIKITSFLSALWIFTVYSFPT